MKEYDGCGLQSGGGGGGRRTPVQGVCGCSEARLGVYVAEVLTKPVPYDVEVYMSEGGSTEPGYYTSEPGAWSTIQSCLVQ